MASRGNHNSLFGSLRAVLFVAGLLLLISPSALSQTKPNTSNQTPPPTGEPRTPKDEKSDPFHDFGSSPERDMRFRQILKEEKKQYEENLARAREASDLAAELMKTYEARQSFNTEDTKKFEKLEKLTKRIRNEAGGSDTDPDVSDIPGVLEHALKRVVDLASDLRKLVEKTPRHVTSLAVIDRANKLLGLLQRVRFWR